MLCLCVHCSPFSTFLTSHWHAQPIIWVWDISHPKSFRLPFQKCLKSLRRWNQMLYINRERSICDRRPRSCLCYWLKLDDEFWRVHGYDGAGHSGFSISNWPVQNHSKSKHVNDMIKKYILILHAKQLMFKLIYIIYIRHLADSHFQRHPQKWPTCHYRLAWLRQTSYFRSISVCTAPAVQWMNRGRAESRDIDSKHRI